MPGREIDRGWRRYYPRRWQRRCRHGGGRGVTSTPSARGARPFRVRAEDGEDLTIAAAHLQDAVATVGDVAFLPDERR
ncbi:MAG: DUF2948 family protein, partial [Pseudomonadota bacterium]|nr:DUF2948 family protein [Pseudomonadota bacterium]